jgi:hypothetical protein
MDKFLEFINSIDWIFAGVVLVGGRYWGGKYFKISKNPSHNFLAFATLFGLIWLLLKYMVNGAFKDEWMDLFITYLFVTSFYELLAKRLFEWIEGLFPKAKQ